MRISDWSSDVCSSDLIYWIICVQSIQSDKFGEVNVRSAMEHAVSGNNDEANGSDIPSPVSQPLQFRCADGVLLAGHLWQGGGRGLVIINAATGEIGSASCRERVCRYV